MVIKSMLRVVFGCVYVLGVEVEGFRGDLVFVCNVLLFFLKDNVIELNVSRC